MAILICMFLIKSGKLEYNFKTFTDEQLTCYILNNIDISTLQRKFNGYLWKLKQTNSRKKHRIKVVENIKELVKQQQAEKKKVRAFNLKKNKQKRDNKVQQNDDRLASPESACVGSVLLDVTPDRGSPNLVAITEAALTRLRAQMLRRVQIVTGPDNVNDLLIMEFVLT